MDQQVVPNLPDFSTDRRRAAAAPANGCPRALALHVHPSARRCAVLSSREFEITGRPAAHACRLVAGIIDGIKCWPRAFAVLSRAVHRTAAASSCTCSDAAAEGRTDCPSSDAHWTDLFSVAAAHFRSCRAPLLCQALRRAACHARSYLCCMSVSLASKPSIGLI